MSAVAEPDLAELDLNDFGLFADGPPWELFARMRAEAPVVRNASQGDGPEFWSLTRYEDINAAIKDWETFSSARGGSFLVEGGILPKEFTSLIFNMMDPPEHDRHRGILQKVFTAKAVSDREPDIRETTNRLIDGVIERGECDFVKDIAVELPLAVTANMLGVPLEDRDKLFHWTNQFADTSVPAEDKMAAMVELGGYLIELVAARRAEPTDDLLSRLVHAELDGEQLNDAEIMAHFAQLMNGGNETTRNALAGGVLALAEHADQRQALLDDPTLIKGAVEEILRWHTPIIHNARTVTRTIEIGGVEIAEGEKVGLWHASGNRDESANEDPDRFDISRPKVNHLAFGAGRHFCLGNQLARLELAVALPEIIRRMPDLEPAGPVEKKPNNSFHWMISMPVTFEAGVTAG